MSERYGRKVSFIQPGMDRLEECKRVFENSALYDCTLRIRISWRSGLRARLRKERWSPP